jgi:hypothetical protein
VSDPQKCLSITVSHTQLERKVFQTGLVEESERQRPPQKPLFLCLGNEHQVKHKLMRLGKRECVNVTAFSADIDPCRNTPVQERPRVDVPGKRQFGAGT